MPRCRCELPLERVRQWVVNYAPLRKWWEQEGGNLQGFVRKHRLSIEKIILHRMRNKSEYYEIEALSKK